MKNAGMINCIIVLISCLHFATSDPSNHFTLPGADTILVNVNFVYPDNTAEELKTDNSFVEILRSDFKKRGDKLKRYYDIHVEDSLSSDYDYVLTIAFLNFKIGDEKIEQTTRLASRTISRTVFDLAAQEHKVRNENVQADVTYVKKNLTCNLELKIELRDGKENKELLNKSAVGIYNWSNEFITFNGSQDALTTEEQRLAKNREKFPPNRPLLIKNVELQVYNDLTGELDKFFREKKGF